MNNHNHRILVLIFTSIIVCFSSRAQTQSSDSTSLKEGIWALQFGIAGNFTLTSFQGSTIGAKYQLSDKNAIRGGITISGSTGDGTSSNSGSISDSSYGTVPGSSSTKSATISLVIQYLWYMNPNGHVHFYTGLGPFISYSYSKYSSDSPYLNTVYNDGSYEGYWEHQFSASNSTQWGVGGSGVVGVEWFASRWLSLHADYSEGIQYRWGSNSSSQGNSPSTAPNYLYSNTDSSGKSKGWALSNGGVAFGLNIYL